MVYRNSRNTSSKRAFFTSSLVRTSKVHSLSSLMIARGSYEYKATSSHCDLTLGGQAAFWVSVELLKARGHIGGGHQCLLHPSVQPCIPASLHLSTASSWPHSRSHRQVCLQICQETEQYHTSCLHEDRGQPPPLPLQFSFQNISESFLSH